MPQFDILGDGTAMGLNLLWFIITFGLTMLIVSVGLRRIETVRSERDALTSGNIDRAQNLSDEAKAMMAAYEEKMATARSEAQTIIKAASDEAAAEAAEAQAKLAADLATKQASVEKAIADQTSAALSELSDVASDTAQIAASQVLGVKLDDKKLTQAVKELGNG